MEVIYSNIQRMLREHRKYHSALQLTRFVLQENSGGSWYGYYRQALRELHSRVRALQNSMIERVRIERQAERLEKSRKQDADLDLMLKKIELDEMNLRIAEVWRELCVLYQCAMRARKELPPVLTEEIRNKLELEAFEGETKRNAKLDMDTAGRLGRETVRAVRAIGGIEEMNFGLDFETPELPDAETVRMLC